MLDALAEIDAELIKPVVSAGNSNFLKNIFNQSIEGNALFSSIKVNGKSYKSWDMKVQVKDKRLTFDGGPEDTIHGLIDDSGSFKLLFLKPFPIVMEADGIINKNKIDSNAVIKRLDITVLNLPLRNGAIVFKSGNATGSIRISGPINDPDIYGNMDVSNGKANSQFTPVLIQPLNARLIFTGKGFTLEKMTTYVNKRPLVVKGNFKIDHWVPDAFDMEFNSPDPLGVKFAYNFGPIIVDGYVNGEIRVKGDLFGTTVNGSLTANYCKIALAERKPEQKILEQVNNDMALVFNVCSSSRDFRRMLLNPIIKFEKKQAIVEEIFVKHLHKLSLSFLSIIARKRREVFIHQIAEQFIIQYKIKS